MRFSDSMRFPHPVLRSQAADFQDATFAAEFEMEEVTNSGKLALIYDFRCGSPSIQQLLNQGTASVGVVVTCEDTYWHSVEEVYWPRGRMEFEPGSVLHRVEVRPIIWLCQDLDAWPCIEASAEFPRPISLGKGTVIGFGDRFNVSVGNAKLAAWESIFTLRRDESAIAGSIDVNTDSDRIEIRASPDAYDAIVQLRGQAKLSSVTLAAIYLPVIMSVLEQIRDQSELAKSRRWFTPFQARCDVVGIELTSPNLLQDAQQLLGLPIVPLRRFAEEM